ncbi:MAG TPA: protein-L-isoaspartate(D-aspartate) O-methyltransferase [Terriglobales bacterium]|nr:protein-L-isoaspartate(D-aspartate) O-methyltransferase [Terriglobales bacterium]
MSAASGNDAFEPMRLRMVATQICERGVRDPRVLDAMRRVPRHLFVPRGHERDAYEDHPIPIGEGQTISQPYVVAAMTEALAPQPEDTVLEIGTGSGYQTAVLAELVSRVYSIERIASLANRGREALERAGYRNVSVVVGDGSEGLPGAAPFDAILVTAAAPALPQALFDQLREGGRMVVPIGTYAGQQLWLVRKAEGKPVSTGLDLVRFVPLIGAQGYDESW